MDNMFNLSQVSKKTVDTQKRIEKQSNDYLNESYRKQREEAAAKEKAINENLMASARLSYGASIERSKNRVRSLQEEIRYTNTATTIAMTEMISQIVEGGLLLDEEEYSALNPNYKDEIHSMVRGFLENANIQTVNKPEMLAIMEYVSSVLPSADQGKYLTEDELYTLINRDKPVEIENAIKNLSGNVANRVAVLVEKEQKKVDKIQKELEEVAPAKKNEEAVEQEPEAQEEVPEEEMVEEQPAEEAPVEGEEGQMPSKQIHIDPNGNASVLTDKSQITFNPDGSMDIALAEKVIVRETPRCGLLESLAVNEATNMLAEGKEYNSDLCLANAVLYMTIVEAMGETGLVNVNDNTYASIISNAGGNLSEGLFARRSAENKRKKAGKLREKVTKLQDKIEKLEAEADAKDPKGSLTESVVTQWKPNLNRSSSNDLAERIRQKRLLQEQARKNLNE